MSSKTKTNATKEDATPALVPKLRFPEFREAGEWVVRQFDDLFVVGNGRDYKHLEPGDVPVFGSGGYMLSVKDYLYDGESVCIGRKGTIDKPMFLTGRFWTVDTLFFTHSFAHCLPRFIFSVFQQIDWSSHNEAGGVPSLSKTNIQRIKTLVPSLPEQARIADCLSSLDELLAAQARKVEALKTHKKGLMEQLFPREGETQPRLRFPEFQDAGEWEEKKLGDVVTSFKTGKLDANAMVENGKYRFYTCAKNYFQIDNYAFEGEALLVAGNGAHLGYIHHYIGKFNAYQRTYVLQRFDANVVFLRCLLERYLPSRILLEKKDGNTPYIVLSTLTEMPLVVPQNPAEQARIADCLTSLDELIAAEAHTHEALKTHKKGLMQQLFPSPQAVEHP